MMNPSGSLFISAKLAFAALCLLICNVTITRVEFAVLFARETVGVAFGLPVLPVNSAGI
jgi:hypothetical protein